MAKFKQNRRLYQAYRSLRYQLEDLSPPVPASLATLNPKRYTLYSKPETLKARGLSQRLAGRVGCLHGVFGSVLSCLTARFVSP